MTTPALRPLSTGLRPVLAPQRRHIPRVARLRGQGRGLAAERRNTPRFVRLRGQGRGLAAERRNTPRFVRLRGQGRGLAAERRNTPRFARLRGQDRRNDGGRERGSAIVEFIFVAVVVMVPLMYVIVAVAQVQRTQLAVSQAARDAGRAFATSDTAAEAGTRVRAAVRLALRDQGLPDDATVRFVAAGASCSSPAITPHLRAGAQFGVCVSRRSYLPGVPSILSGRGITTTSEYVVHVDDFRYFG